MNKKSNATLLGYLIAAGFELATGVVVLMFTAYVVVDIWSWWMVPAGLPALPFWVAVGLDFILSLFRGPYHGDGSSKAKIEAISETCSGDFDYVLSVGKLTLARRIGVAAWVLITWGAAAAMHQWLE